MNTTTFPTKSIGALLNDDAPRRLPPIPIPPEIAERMAFAARRDAKLRHRRQQIALVAEVALALGSLLYLASR